MSTTTEIIKKAVSLAKRNGKPEDPDQKKAIAQAALIAKKLLKVGQFQEAASILAPLCNMTMGPLKATLAYDLIKIFITKGKFEYIKEMLISLSKLSGDHKINVAEKTAYWLMVYHHHHETTLIQHTLNANDKPYAKQAAKRIDAFIKIATLETKDTSEALRGIKQNPELAKDVAIRYGVRNGKPEEAEQIQALSMTMKLLTALMDQNKYELVYQVLDRLCNMTMGPLKSEAILLMSNRYIKNKEPEYAKKIAEKSAALKGNIKLKTAVLIGSNLIKNHYLKESESIVTILKAADNKEAQAAIKILESLQKKFQDKSSQTQSINIDQLQTQDRINNITNEEEEKASQTNTANVEDDGDISGYAKDSEPLEEKTPENMSEDEQKQFYDQIDHLVRTCIKAGFENQPKGKASNTLIVNMNEVLIEITKKRILVRHIKAKNTLSYTVGSMSILINNKDRLADSHCGGYLIWIKSLIKDWSSPKPELQLKWEKK